MTESIIKEFHRILKTGTADAQKSYFNVGDYKQLANEVGGRETSKPAEVAKEMKSLQEWYHAQKDVTIHTLAEYHWRFESIHPFQDGNGRVGRLILFRECLRQSIMPFVIDNEHKMCYYRGLTEFKQTVGFLVGTMQSAQDVYEAWIKYFNEELLEGLEVWMTTQMQKHIREANQMFYEERRRVQERYKEYDGTYLRHYVQYFFWFFFVLGLVIFGLAIFLMLDSNYHWLK